MFPIPYYRSHNHPSQVNHINPSFCQVSLLEVRPAQQ